MKITDYLNIAFGAQLAAGQKNDTMEKFFDFIKNNKLIAAIIGVIGVSLLFPRVFRKIFGGAARRRHRRHVHKAITGTHRRRRRAHRAPAAVVHRAHRRHAAKRRTAHRTKKPWQIKGSLAAKRRMAQIRRMR